MDLEAKLIPCMCDSFVEQTRVQLSWEAARQDAEWGQGRFASWTGHKAGYTAGSGEQSGWGYGVAPLACGKANRGARNEMS